MKYKDSEHNIILQSIFRATLISMIVADLAEVIAAGIDGMLTGRYLGANSLAAFGIAKPFYSITGILSAVLSSGAMTVSSHWIGSGDVYKTRQIFSLTCFLGVVLSVTATALGIIFINPFTRILGANADLFFEVRRYLLGLLLGVPAIVMGNVLSIFLQLDGKRTNVTLSVFATVIVNLGGDAFNIFYLKGDMFGMGLATSASYYAALIVLLYSFIKQDSMMRFRFRDIDYAMTGELLSKGMPKATRRICNVFRPMIINHTVIMIGGSIAMSALSVQHSSSDFLELLGTCLADVVVLMCGIYYGERNREEIANTLSMSFRYIMFGVMSVTAFAFLGARLIASFYLGSNIQAIEAAIPCIKLYALKLPFLAFNEIYMGYFQAIGDTRYSHAMSVLHRFVYVCASVVILGSIFGIIGVWAAFPVSEILFTITILILAALHERHLPRKIHDMLFLPASFGINPENRFHRFIRSREDAVSTSKEAYNFCAEKKIIHKRSMLVALCIEELGINAVTYGFSRKNQIAEVSITAEGDDLKLRFCDNGRLFDLKQWFELFHSDDLASHIGIRMLFGLANDISYMNTMNTNNVIIKL